VKIVVGGAPVTRQWAEEIGADGYAKDAMSAVTLVRSLIDHHVAVAR
jgi:methanogenic corrinoid protein MtbC1